MSEKTDLYRKAIEKWGVEAQLGMVKEELAELIVAVNQWERNRITPKSLISEIADVSIMIDQLKMIANFSTADVEKQIDFKLNRLAERL